MLFIFFLKIIVSTIFDIEYITIKTPSDAVIAIVPKFGFIIIIKPQTIEITEQIKIDIQLPYSCFLSNMDNLKSIVDLVTIIIPATIGNNIFIKSGLSNRIIPSNNSIIPKVKKFEKNKFNSFWAIKYIPLIINVKDSIYVIVSNDTSGNIINVSPISNIKIDIITEEYKNLFNFFIMHLLPF